MFERIKQKQSFHELVRFGIVGLIAMSIHYGVYWFLIKIINPTLAYTVGYGISLVFNFILSVFFTFRTSPDYKKGIRFVLSHGINYLLHISLLQLFLYVGVPKVYAPFPVLAIAIPVNFMLVRAALTSKHKI
jgi:putative flippase GtrA